MSLKYYNDSKPITQKEYDKLKDENKLDENIIYIVRQEESDKYKQALEKIKPILEYYASSKVGTLQEDGTYKYFISEKQQPTFYATGASYPKEIITYDPRPAQEALQIIKECKKNER